MPGVHLNSLPSPKSEKLDSIFESFESLVLVFPQVRSLWWTSPSLSEWNSTSGNPTVLPIIVRRYDYADANAKVQQDLILTNAFLNRAKFGFVDEPPSRGKILQNQHSSGSRYLSKLDHVDSSCEFLFNDMLRTWLDHPIFLNLEEKQEKQYWLLQIFDSFWTLLDQFNGSRLSACSVSNVVSDTRWRCTSRSLAQASQIRFCLNKTHCAFGS